MTPAGLVAAFKGRYELVSGGGFTGKRWHVLPELWWDETERPCSVCKGSTHWYRPRKGGAATHPGCEGSLFDGVTEAVHVEVIYTLATVLGASTVTEPQVTRAEPSVRRLGNPQAGCELCGRGYAALWIAARTWRCRLCPPSNETYRRRH